MQPLRPVRPGLGSRVAIAAVTRRSGARVLRGAPNRHAEWRRRASRRRRSMGSVGEWRLASAPTSNRGYLPADRRRSADVGDGGPLRRRLGGTPTASGPLGVPADRVVGDPDGEDGRARRRPTGLVPAAGARSAAHRPAVARRAGRATGDHRTSAALHGAAVPAPGPALRWLSG